MVQKQIGKRIFDLRKQKKWTQQELADKAGKPVTREIVCNLETNRRGLSRPNLEVLTQITKALGSNINWIILGEKDNK